MQSANPQRTSLFHAVGTSLFWGMGIICGQGTTYTLSFLARTDKEALKGDMEAVGRDMWTTLDRIRDEMKDKGQYNLPL